MQELVKYLCMRNIYSYLGIIRKIKLKTKAVSDTIHKIEQAKNQP